MSFTKVIIDAIRRSEQEKYKNKVTLILKEDTSERYLPVIISSIQADILAGAITGTSSIESLPAPEILAVNASPSDIICVTIHSENDVYYAKVLLYPQDKPLEVKCPIGVALALAYYTEVTIFINNRIMDNCSLTLPCEWTGKPVTP